MRLTKKLDNGFYHLKPENEIYGEENGIRLVQIVGHYEDLEEQIGCPLEVRLKVTHNTSIYDVEGNEYIVSHIDKEVFEVYSMFYMTFRWEHYKKTWWLKEDKSE